MKYILALSLSMWVWGKAYSQETPVAGFLNGKSVVLVSASQSAVPMLTWQELAREIHTSLVEAGGDPVAYFELEDVTLTEGNQRAYAEAFQKRLIKTIVIVTRPSEGSYFVYLAPFSNDNRVILPNQGTGLQAADLPALKASIAGVAQSQASRNFLVLDIPEFPVPPTSQGGAPTATYIPQAPLNLNVFKLGILLAGVSGDGGYLNTFRHDLLGKSEQQRLAEQQAEKEGLESVLKAAYPYEVAFIDEALTNQQLIQNRVQFMLMRIEGREADLMRTMGLAVPADRDTNRIVVKYYVKLLLRSEFYIGETWDADPNWRSALSNFLRQISQ